MNGYTLAKGELEILRERSATLVEGGEERRLDEALLTNLQIVLTISERRGLFKRDIRFKRYPLVELQRTEGGHPQAFADKAKDRWVLRLLFEGEAVALRFPDEPKKGCLVWARAIEKASAGDMKGAVAAGNSIPEIDALIDGARSAVGTIFGSVGAKRGAECRGTASAPAANVPDPSTVKPTPVALRCVSCHAPISGKRGERAVCAYCGTAQTL